MTTYGDLITADGQIQWAGMVFGDGVLTYTDTITGWEDHPGVDSGNVARPSSPGSWSGPKLPQERVVTWSGAWRPPRGGSDDGSLLRALRAATSIIGSADEQPLVVRLLGETLMSWGAVTNRALPSDHSYGVRAGTLAIQWVCSNPLRFGLTENHNQITLPVSSSTGLTYPLTYPLSYGTEVVPPTAVVINLMEAPTPARLVFVGPMSVPTLTNTTTGSAIGYDLDLTALDSLEVDTAAGTVLLNGVDRSYARTVTSDPVRDFLLNYGANNLQLSAESFTAGATVDIYWRDATL